MEKKTMLTIDLGASNGRAMLGMIEKGKYSFELIHRFPNDPVCINGISYWDFPRLFHEVKQSLIKTKNITGQFPDSIGIDAWGASFGLLDDNGDLIANPMHYRNECVGEIVEELEDRVSREELFLRQGYLPNSIFNLYFMFYLLKRKPKLLSAARHFINIPDLFNTFLTGKIVSERTSIAPSLLYRINDSVWDWELIKDFGIDKTLFEHKIYESGTVIGNIRKEICDELSIEKDIKVVAVIGHDSTSAAIAVPLKDTTKKYGYLNCGTWSVFGTEINDVKPTKQIFDMGITFDEGTWGKKHLRKNLNGLWFQQECKREWEMGGKQYTYSELETLSRKARPFIAKLDVNDTMFNEAGNMTEKIDSFIKKTHQGKLETIGEYNRVIIESLAFEYQKTLSELESVLGYKLDNIYMMGGGIQNELLCQMTADALNRTVFAGPVEASAAGNLIAQAIALNIVDSIQQFREEIECAESITKYSPKDPQEWNK